MTETELRLYFQFRILANLVWYIYFFKFLCNEELNEDRFDGHVYYYPLVLLLSKQIMLFDSTAGRRMVKRLSQ